MDKHQTDTAPGAKPLNQGRIYFMDEVRGFDIILMVFYHGFFTIGYIFDNPFGTALFAFFMPAEAFFAGLFIFICGISCRLSHNNWKRGGLLLLIALGITAVLYIFMPEEIIWFGILHFLSVAILLFAALRPLLDKVPPIAGVLACAALMLLTWWVPVYQGSLFGIKGLLEWPVPVAWKAQAWLYPLGFGDLTGSDYFPLFPWIFCLLGGSFFGIWAKAGKFPKWMYRQRVPFFSLVGKHTLLIYILHQPVIYGICWLIVMMVKGVSNR